MNATERELDYLDEKLQEAREHAGGYGDLRGLKETADEEFKQSLAIIRNDVVQTGTVADIDARVRRHPGCAEAITVKRNRYADWTTAELYVKILWAEVEKYRTDAATDRTIDRQHR
jgi:hypothetical protein